MLMTPNAEGDAVLDVVREIGNFQVTSEEKRQDSRTWTMFDGEEIHILIYLLPKTLRTR
ncbi:hypothetical protein OROGR_017064 [Orobanche gracilis]